MSARTPRKGDLVRARRYVQPTLTSGDPLAEFQFECTGTADGGAGMRTASGDYLDFGWVHLPGGWHDGTSAYLVTEVALIPGRPQ